MKEGYNDINKNYERFWKAKSHEKVYPTEFVVRTFLANYPNLDIKKPEQGQKILDIGFGDGRNIGFLCDLGLEVYGVEITNEIVEYAQKRLEKVGHIAKLHVGRNSHLPFKDSYFDYILACHSCYYCDENESFNDNMREYSRVLKKDGFVIASIGDAGSYIFEGAEKLHDGSFRINNDPYGNRNGYRLQAFDNTEEIKCALTENFDSFSFGSACNDYYGINERVFWVVCKKR